MENNKKYFLIFFLVWIISKCYCDNIISINNIEFLKANLVQEIMNRYVNRFNVSKECNKDVILFLNGIKYNKIWALQMLDSSSKIPSGILSGNIHDSGTFDECIAIDENVDSKNILGQYCLVDISVNATNLNRELKLVRPVTKVTRSICLPNSCSNKDVEKLFESFNITASVSEESCQTQNYTSTIDSISLPIIIFFAFVLFLMLTSTLYVYIIENIYQTKGSATLSAFSVFKNLKKIFTINKNFNDISCMYGIRVISMVWVIFGHLYAIIQYQPVENGIDAHASLVNHGYDFVLGGYKAVDTFLLLSGITLCYVFLSTIKDHKFNLFIFYLHRYLRLTPALGAVILIQIGLLKYFSSGPYWLIMSMKESKICLDKWWKTIIYINNDMFDMCLPHCWYLSVEMQLYVMSPIILIILKKKPYIGLSLIGFFVVCVMAVSFIITWSYNLPTNAVYTTKEYEFYSIYYSKTYTRAAPWLIGIVIGYIIYIKKQGQNKIIINSLIVIFLWVISIAAMGFCGLYEFQSFDNHPYARLRNSLYNAFQHTIWSAALGWIVFACCFRYGGVINSFLSLSIFQILSKLTYSIYLIHFAVIYTFVGRIRTTLHLTHSDMFMKFWGVYMYCIFASVILSLAFESPIFTIEKVLFKKKFKKDEKLNVAEKCIY